MKPSQLVPVGLGALVCLWLSCNGAKPAEAQTRSSYSESQVAEPTLPEGLTVRPDVLLVTFSFFQTAESMGEALPELKKAVERYVSSVSASGKNEVSVRMGHLETGHYKMGTPYHRVSGVLEVALPESLDFWSRAALVATLTELGAKESATLEKADGLLRASFSAPQAWLRHPEAYRVELMKRWVVRTRDFIEQARSERTALQFVHCDPPEEVKQQTLSLDEVSLSLAAPRCQLGLAAP